MKLFIQLAVGLTSLYATLAFSGVAEGIDFYQRGQYKEARTELEPAAMAGNMEAMAYLGDLYLRGLGGARNELKAREYITMAATDGKLPRAIHQLGLMYVNGNLVTRDETKGVDLIQKAAEASHPPSQFMLGLWLYRGTYGFAKDPNAALAWFKAAANQKDPDGMNWLGLYAESGQANVPKDMLVALDWYRKAAELKNANAAYNVGRIYVDGLGVQSDLAEGLKWLRRAAIFGDTYAFILLGRIYEQGLSGAAKDLGIAAGWYGAVPVSASSTTQRASRDAYDRISKLLGSEFAEQERRGKAVVGQEMMRSVAENILNNTQTQTRRGVYGSAVFVSKNGDVLTNEHVIQGCERIRINPQRIDVKVIAKDVKNDLALLRIEGSTTPPAAQFRLGRGIRSGDEVIAVGYPLKGLLSSGPVVTNGIVNALSGAANDSSNFQLSATVQPGSSGGGVWDRDGLFVGLVKARYLSTSTVNAQNINFGINLATIMGFLDNNAVDYGGKAAGSGKLSIAATTELANKSTAQIECY